MGVSGERRIVSVLISDVVDSTVIAERLGPERSKFLVDELAQLMASEVQRFDGTVAQLTGDGLLALFGAPIAHGDDAERAVRAALGIHDALDRHATDMAGSYGIELAARVAVNTGPVVVPGRDSPPDVLSNALGDPVNVAARLQSHVTAGGLVVGPATARWPDGSSSRRSASWSSRAGPSVSPRRRSSARRAPRAGLAARSWDVGTSSRLSSMPSTGCRRAEPWLARHRCCGARGKVAPGAEDRSRRDPRRHRRTTSTRFSPRSWASHRAPAALFAIPRFSSSSRGSSRRRSATSALRSSPSSSASGSPSGSPWCR